MDDTVPPQIDHHYSECENDLPSRVKLLLSIVVKELRKSLRASAGDISSNSTTNTFQAIVFCGSEDRLASCHDLISKGVNQLRDRMNGSLSVGDVRYLSESAMFLHERSKALNAFRFAVEM